MCLAFLQVFVHVGRVLCVALLSCALGFVPSSSAVDPPQVEVIPRESLESYSWEELAVLSRRIASSGSDDEALQVAREFHLVDESGCIDTRNTKRVELADGLSVHVIVLGFRQDADSSGRAAGITFAFADSFVMRPMNTSQYNTGGWEESALRLWLNTDFLEELPADLRRCIVPVVKATPDGNETENMSSTTTTVDRLWLLSYDEVLGGTQYRLFNEAGLLLREANEALVRRDVATGASCPWWLRTPAVTHFDGFANVSADGHVVAIGYADMRRGVVPCFCVG